MKIAIMIDAKTNEVITERQYGVMGFISFRRLAETLENCGEIREGSEITHFMITDCGIEYRLSN